MNTLECSQDFSHYKSMGIFPDAQWPNFKVVQDVIVVLVTCKNEEDLNKNEGDRVLTLYINFFRRARADNSGVGGGIWPKF